MIPLSRGPVPTRTALGALGLLAAVCCLYGCDSSSSGPPIVPRPDPPVAGEFADLELELGDEVRFNLRSGFSGTVSRWTVTSSDPAAVHARYASNDEAWITARQLKTVTVTVRAQNTGGEAQTAFTVRVVPRETTPAVVDTLAPVSLSVGGSSVAVDVAAAFTPAGVPIEARSRNTGVATAAVGGSVVIFTPVAAGNTSVEITARNASGSATLTIAVTVTAASPRAVGTLPPLSLSVGGSPVEVDVRRAFAPSGLRVAATSGNTQVVTVAVSGSVLTLTPVGAGSTTITVTARNASGSVSQSIAVTVTAEPPRATGTGSESVTIDYRTSLVIPLSELFTTSGFAIEVESSNDQVATGGLERSDPSRLVIDAVGGGQATITVTASNAAGSATYTFHVTVPALTPPTVTGSPQPLSLTVGDPPASINLDSLLSAPTGLNLMVEARSGDTRVVTADTSPGLISTLVVTPVGPGATTVTVVAQNEHGSASVSIPVTVTGAGAPTTVETAYTVELVHGGSPAGLEMNEFFAADSPESLTLEVESGDDTVARLETEEYVSRLGVLGYFVWIWPDGAGDTNVVATVRNESGSASLTFPVAVAAAQPLTIVEQYPPQTVTVGAGLSSILSRYVSPPGFRVEALSRDENIVKAKGFIEGPGFSFQAIAPGKTTIDVTAINAAGSVTLEVEVTVVESLLFGQVEPE